MVNFIISVLGYIVSGVISVVASIVGYYICKWLDGDDSDN
mgnify:FL=1